MCIIPRVNEQLAIFQGIINSKTKPIIYISVVPSYIRAWGRKKNCYTDPAFIYNFDILFIIGFALILIKKYWTRTLFILIDNFGPPLNFAHEASLASP